MSDHRALLPLHRRIMLMMGRGTLNLTSDGDGQQRMQVGLLDGELRDAVDRVQQYGLSAHPMPGARVVVACMGGNRDHPVIIAADDPRHRPTGIKPGEVALYSAAGQLVLLREDQGLEITTATGTRIEVSPENVVTVECEQVVLKAAVSVRLETPLLEVTGIIRDRADSGGVSMDQMRDFYNGHGHPAHSAPPVPLMS
ncbi:phage baseplate assembly protein V [Humitalea sp. 24SJ18S-53]|uniref:phage baseplate assembly protein V n=1 Tax=Humitalea sp. 24SJ18S-53 TaxID=3422307 RepID=UPI003D669B8B